MINLNKKWSIVGSFQGLILNTNVFITEKEIMDVLADSAENNTLLKRDMVFAQMNFCLKSGVFRIIMSEDDEGRTNCK